MNDTAPQMTAKVREMLRQKTSAERLSMACSLHEFSKQLVTSFILRENPNLSAGLLRRELFLKFYRDDFDPTQRKNILNYLMSDLRGKNEDF